jgi:hypothetical protein
MQMRFSSLSRIRINHDDHPLAAYLHVRRVSGAPPAVSSSLPQPRAGAERMQHMSEF